MRSSIRGISNRGDTASLHARSTGGHVQVNFVELRYRFQDPESIWGHSKIWEQGTIIAPHIQAGEFFCGQEQWFEL